jgi:hypothetical protein
MPRNQRLLVIIATLAIGLVLMLGIAFAAPGGTVILDPPAATRSGLPGTTVTHTLRITNAEGTAAIPATLTLTYTGNQWLVSLPVTQAQLAGNASAEFSVLVTIPPTPTVTSDTVTVTVHQEGNAQALTSQLTTQFFRVHLPSVLNAFQDPCRPTGESYGSIEIPNWEPSPPAETHPDINLAVRGYTPTVASLKLVDLGDTDPSGPQLDGLYATPRLPAFKAAYRVYDWDWVNQHRGDPIDDWDVTMLEMAAIPGETIHVPGRDDGQIAPGYKALVLYASPTRLTLKYTSEDTMATGFGLHLENICVDENLLALYTALNNDGRHSLPAVRTGQAIGRASRDRIGVAVRDTGSFMDPRSHYDWWRGY